MVDYNLFAVLVVVLLGLLSLKLLLLIPKGGKHRLPPSPPRLPILGNLHQLGTLPHQSLNALSKKYGPVMLLHLGHSPTLVLSSDQAVREMIKDHDIIFSDRPQPTAAKILFRGPKDVGFVPYGEYWRQMRKVVTLELLSLKRVRSFCSVREEEVTILIEKISQGCSRGCPVDLSKFLLTLTNGISCRCILGRKCEDENGKDRFAELTQKIAVHLLEFSFGDFFPSVGWIDACTGLIARIKKTRQELDIFLDQIIEEHKNQLHDDDDDYSDRSDIVQILLKLERDDLFGFDFTKDHLKAILLDMIAGGTDTTFAAMEWTFSELIKHPNIMKKVQEEVRSVVGTKSKIDEDDISQMEYLKCVVKETLRMHPSLPLQVPRQTSSSIKLGNYDIPAKTKVFVNAWAIQRNSKIWDRAEEFIPERFQGHNLDFAGQDFRFIPFGGGRRGCPGITFGIATTEYILANLLHRFNWKLPSDAKTDELDMSEGFGLITSRKTPLYLVPTMYSP